MTAFARIPPELEIAKSVYNSVLKRSAIKLPRLVSCVLNLENLPSISVFEYPIGLHSFYSSFLVYLATWWSILPWFSKSFDILTLSEMNNLFKSSE